jgi:hypothetical protein
MYSFQPGLGVQLMLSDVTSMILVRDQTVRLLVHGAGGLGRRRLGQAIGLAIERLFGPRSQASANNISRAQAGGTLRPDVPPHVAIDLLEDVSGEQRRLDGSRNDERLGPWVGCGSIWSLVRRAECCTKDPPWSGFDPALFTSR